MTRVAAFLVVCLLAQGCSATLAGSPDSQDGATRFDAAGLDAGTIDFGGAMDADRVDSGGASDGGARDDMALHDSGGIDAARDSGGLDAGAHDAGADAGDVPPACPVCATYSSATSVGITDATVLVEASGLAASRDHAGVMYTHNDEGMRYYALDSSAAIIATVIASAEADCGGGAARCDVEEMAVGPCPSGGGCVFLGNIGVNGSGDPATHAVYRSPERASLSGTVTVDFDKFAYTFPDGNHNAEAMIVHPVTGEIYIITKRTDDVSQPSRVYKFPMPSMALAPGSTYTLVEVSSDLSRFSGELVTSADVSPCGERLLIRTYGHLYELSPSGASFESIFTATSASTRMLPVSSDSGGEACAYAADGASYYTITEHLAATTPLYQYTCTAP
ncbi:MAG: hypothetical protein IPK60_07925 [Sandaracinaceae bacterium]|nr:hypothetical protein [Sandaracinaceae bacterium]